MKLYYEEVDSTNNEARRLILNKEINDRDIVIARKQSNGKGRLGNTWLSVSDENIYMSEVIFVSKFIPLPKLPAMTMLAGLALFRAIDKTLKYYKAEDYNLGIKWPNDILLNNKKLAGILVEAVNIQDDDEYESDYAVIIGLGVNVGQEKKELLDNGLVNAESISTLFKDKNSDYDEIIMEIIDSFHEFITDLADTFLNDKHATLSFILREYNTNLINSKKTISYLQGENLLKGIAEGIDEKGRLIVRAEDGSTHKILAGEVRTQGIY